MVQVSTAWQLAKDHVTAPIVGTSKFENLTDIIGEFLVEIFESLTLQSREASDTV